MCAATSAAPPALPVDDDYDNDVVVGVVVVVGDVVGDVVVVVGDVVAGDVVVPVVLDLRAVVEN